jgi:hypothetical protein
VVCDYTLVILRSEIDSDRLDELCPDASLYTTAPVPANRVVSVDDRLYRWFGLVGIERSKDSLWSEGIGNDVSDCNWSIGKEGEVWS